MHVCLVVNCVSMFPSGSCVCVCVLKRVIDCVYVPCSARPCNILADGAEGAGAGTISGGPAGLLPHLH